ncbi:MAG: glycosyltransferase [Bacteroidota bacterium]
MTASVLVPARNEAACIHHCLGALFAGEGVYDVLVIDDASTDDTSGAVARFAETLSPGERSRLSSLRLESDPSRARAYKKRALEFGIAHLSSDIILTTDADCRPAPDWVASMLARFDEETAFVSGPVVYAYGSSLWEDMQALEFLGLVAIGAGAIGIGRPNMCNGANVAYRRDVFNELGGFSGIDHLTSGDDELLMQKIARETEYSVAFNPSLDALVTTEAVTDGPAFIQQRRRWASKGMHYPSPLLVGMLALIYGFYALLFGSAIATIWVPALLPWVAAGFGTKIASELPLMVSASRHFGRLSLMRYFLFEQLLQIPYVVYIGAAGAFGGYTWKDRRVKR